MQENLGAILNVIAILNLIIYILLLLGIVYLVIDKQVLKRWINYIRNEVGQDSLKNQDEDPDKITRDTIVNAITYVTIMTTNKSKPGEIAKYFQQAILDSPESENCKIYLIKYYGIILDGKLRTYTVNCINDLVYIKTNHQGQLTRLGMDLPTLSMLGFYLYTGLLKPEVTTKVKGTRSNKSKTSVSLKKQGE